MSIAILPLSLWWWWHGSDRFFKNHRDSSVVLCFYPHDAVAISFQPRWTSMRGLYNPRNKANEENIFMLNTIPNNRLVFYCSMFHNRCFFIHLSLIAKQQRKVNVYLIKYTIRIFLCVIFQSKTTRITFCYNFIPRVKQYIS
jgi:hypothetical protein